MFREKEYEHREYRETYNKVLNRELSQFPYGFWTEETAIVCVKHLIENILRWDRKQICEKMCLDVLDRYKLSGARVSAFKGMKLDEIMNMVYKGTYEFYPWEFAYSAKNYWTEKNCVKAARWLVEKRLKMQVTEKNINSITREDFINNGINRAIGVLGLDRVMSMAYPEYWKPRTTKVMYEKLIGCRNNKNGSKTEDMFKEELVECIGGYLVTDNVNNLLDAVEIICAIAKRKGYSEKDIWGLRESRRKKIRE